MSALISKRAHALYICFIILMTLLTLDNFSLRSNFHY